MLHFSCPSFLSFWLTISILKLSILWVREHFLLGSEATTVKFQWNARRDSPDPQTSTTFLCIPAFLGGTGAFHHHHPLFLLCLCCSFTSCCTLCSSLVWRWQGWCPQRCWVAEVTSLGFLSLPLTKLMARRAARATCRAEEAAQEPSTALLCSDTAQFLCADLIYRATSMVTENMANSHRQLQLNIQVLCHLKCLCSCVQTNNDNYLIPGKWM